MYFLLIIFSTTVNPIVELWLKVKIPTVFLIDEFLTNVSMIVSVL